MAKWYGPESSSRSMSESLTDLDSRSLKITLKILLYHESKGSNAKVTANDKKTISRTIIERVQSPSQPLEIYLKPSHGDSFRNYYSGNHQKKNLMKLCEKLRRIRSKHDSKTAKQQLNPFKGRLVAWDIR